MVLFIIISNNITEIEKVSKFLIENNKIKILYLLNKIHKTID